MLCVFLGFSKSTHDVASLSVCVRVCVCFRECMCHEPQQDLIQASLVIVISSHVHMVLHGLGGSLCIRMSGRRNVLTQRANGLLNCFSPTHLWHSDLL